MAALAMTWSSHISPFLPPSSLWDSSLPSLIHSYLPFFLLCFLLSSPFFSSHYRRSRSAVRGRQITRGSPCWSSAAREDSHQVNRSTALSLHCGQAHIISHILRLVNMFLINQIQLPSLSLSPFTYIYVYVCVWCVLCVWAPRNWMLKHGVPDKEIKAFDADHYLAGFVHIDVPSTT